MTGDVSELGKYYKKYKKEREKNLIFRETDEDGIYIEKYYGSKIEWEIIHGR